MNFRSDSASSARSYDDNSMDGVRRWQCGKPSFDTRYIWSRCDLWTYLRFKDIKSCVLTAVCAPFSFPKSKKSLHWIPLSNLLAELPSIFGSNNEIVASRHRVHHLQLERVYDPLWFPRLHCCWYSFISKTVSSTACKYTDRLTSRLASIPAFKHRHSWCFDTPFIEKLQCRRQTKPTWT